MITNVNNMQALKTIHITKYLFRDFFKIRNSIFFQVAIPTNLYCTVYNSLFYQQPSRDAG